MIENILVLGASGMAGHVIYTYLKENGNYNVYGTVNTNKFDGIDNVLDIQDRKNVLDLIVEIKPDYVVNCIGVLIKGSSSHPEKAIYANAYFPHFLASLSSEYNFRLIHISTDCVFLGDKGSYLEESIKDARDLYGVSKGLGEVNGGNNMTVRTSIIGPELKKTGEGLFDWFMHQKNMVFGYRNAFWSGVTTLELAKFIGYIISNDLILEKLFHLTNNTPISKFDLLSLFSNIFKKNITISDEKDYAVNKSFINTNLHINHSVSGYEKMLLEQKDFMLKHPEFYKHYNLV